MTVRAHYDGHWLVDYLSSAHPHIQLELWQQRALAGNLEIDGRKIYTLDRRVRAGNRVVHTIPDEIEPAVAVDLSFLHEDDDLVVLHKPAPLPMHPCGRFNRNSLIPLLKHTFGEDFLPVHRLDADTTGLVVLAKSKLAATSLAKQFESRQVRKIYLARVNGSHAEEAFVCKLPLTPGPAGEGKRHVASSQATSGLEAETRFRLLHACQRQSLISAEPSSGRTNQIRVHLAALGLPIVGDDSYSTPETFISGRSALCLHAWRLSLVHPRTNVPMHFQDAWPQWAADAASEACAT